VADDDAEREREPEGAEAAAELLEPKGRPPKRRDNTERALGLEVARLFGLSPRLLVTRRSSRSEDEEPTESG
jgi:hypothetical protein